MDGYYGRKLLAQNAQQLALLTEIRDLLAGLLVPSATEQPQVVLLSEPAAIRASEL